MPESFVSSRHFTTERLPSRCIYDGISTTSVCPGTAHTAVQLLRQPSFTELRGQDKSRRICVAISVDLTPERFGLARSASGYLGKVCAGCPHPRMRIKSGGGRVTVTEMVCLVPGLYIPPETDSRIGGCLRTGGCGVGTAGGVPFHSTGGSRGTRPFRTWPIADLSSDSGRQKPRISGVLGVGRLLAAARTEIATSEDSGGDGAMRKLWIVLERDDNASPDKPEGAFGFGVTPAPAFLSAVGPCVYNCSRPRLGLVYSTRVWKRLDGGRKCFSDTNTSFSFFFKYHQLFSSNRLLPHQPGFLSLCAASRADRNPGTAFSAPRHPSRTTDPSCSPVPCK